MNCLTHEQLTLIALGGGAEDVPGGPAAVEHVAGCPGCAEALAAIEASLGRVAAAHAWLDRGHAAARDRLLAAMDGGRTESRARPEPPYPRRRIVTMRRVLMTGAVAAAAVLCLVWTTATPSALAEAGKALREVKSFQCRFTETYGEGDEATKDSGVLCWAPGSSRIESREGGKPVGVRILLRDKAGIDIDHRYETYVRLDPAPGPHSPLLLFHELAKFTGKADRELPRQKIGGKEAKGYEIEFAKVDPDMGEGTLRVWPDPDTKLPLKVELVKPAEGGSMLLEDFAWDVPVGAWFDTTAPAKYDDKTPTPPTTEKQTEVVVRGLKAYAKYCGGKYPAVGMVYGDVTSDRLFAAAGLSSLAKGPTEEEADRDEYRECSLASHGFARMNTIQMHNPDAAYFGKTVGPADKDAVLFRWKLEDGTYRVIFGDLRAETVTAERLKGLERR